MYYPDGNTGNTGEAMATTYLPQGTVYSVFAVGSVYLSSATYDAAGRLVSQARNNGNQQLSMGTTRGRRRTG